MNIFNKVLIFTPAINLRIEIILNIAGIVAITVRENLKMKVILFAIWLIAAKNVSSSALIAKLNSKVRVL